MTWIRSTRCASGGSNCLEINFQKSSFSGDGNCLEAAFKKSSRSTADHGACVEAAYRGQVLVRDSKECHLGDDQPILSFDPTDWEMFLRNLPVSG